MNGDGDGSSLTYSPIGLMINGGSGYLIANNSINLYGDYSNRASSYSNGLSVSTCFYASSAANGITFKNNLIVNTKNNLKTTTTATTGFNAGAWFGGGVGTGQQVSFLDNNNYNTDGNLRGFITGSVSLLYPDLPTWQIATGRDANSFSDIPRFVDSNNLHINAGTTGTLLESHGQNTVGINRDIDGQVRPGPTGSVNGGAIRADIGADEFDGVYLSDIFAPTIVTDSISPAVDACTQKSHTFYLTVFDLGGVDTVQILYSVQGVFKTPFMATKFPNNKYRAVIPAVAPGNQVKVYVYAKDSVNNKITKLIKTYTDAKFNFTATTNADTIALGSTVGLNAILPNSAINMGGTPVISTTGYPSPYNTSWWGNKEQYLYTAAELTAKGFVAGKITELGLSVGSVTTTLPLTNFTISIGHTSLTALSTSFVTTGMNNVFIDPSYRVLANQIESQFKNIQKKL